MAPKLTLERMERKDRFTAVRLLAASQICRTEGERYGEKGLQKEVCPGRERRGGEGLAEASGFLHLIWMYADSAVHDLWKARPSLGYPITLVASSSAEPRGPLTGWARPPPARWAIDREPDEPLAQPENMHNGDWSLLSFRAVGPFVMAVLGRRENGQGKQRALCPRASGEIRDGGERLHRSPWPSVSGPTNHQSIRKAKSNDVGWRRIEPLFRLFFSACLSLTLPTGTHDWP